MGRPHAAGPFEVSTCSHTLQLAEGSYPVGLTVPASGGQTASTTKTVHVRDRLMVVMGDSYASGEGNPEKDIDWGDGRSTRRRCGRTRGATAPATPPPRAPR